MEVEENVDEEEEAEVDGSMEEGDERRMRRERWETN